MTEQKRKHIKEIIKRNDFNNLLDYEIENDKIYFEIKDEIEIGEYIASKNSIKTSELYHILLKILEGIIELNRKLIGIEDIKEIYIKNGKICFLLGDAAFAGPKEILLYLLGKSSVEDDVKFIDIYNKVRANKSIEETIRTIKNAINIETDDKKENEIIKKNQEKPKTKLGKIFEKKEKKPYKEDNLDKLFKW